MCEDTLWPREEKKQTNKPHNLLFLGRRKKKGFRHEGRDRITNAVSHLRPTRLGQEHRVRLRRTKEHTSRYLVRECANAGNPFEVQTQRKA